MIRQNAVMTSCEKLGVAFDFALRSATSVCVRTRITQWRTGVLARLHRRGRNKAPPF